MLRPKIYLNSFIVNFGQNFAGWVKLRAAAPTGTMVRLRFAEVLDEEGLLDVRNLRGTRNTDQYVFAGTGEAEDWEPTFTYHGFRFVQIEGVPFPAPRLVTRRTLRPYPGELPPHHRINSESGISKPNFVGARVTAPLVSKLRRWISKCQTPSLLRIQ